MRPHTTGVRPATEGQAEAGVLATWRLNELIGLHASTPLAEAPMATMSSTFFLG